VPEESEGEMRCLRGELEKFQVPRWAIDQKGWIWVAMWTVYDKLGMISPVYISNDLDGSGFNINFVPWETDSQS
jgi:hypothetical protein